MKRINHLIRQTLGLGLALALLIGSLSGVTSCKKARLFTTIDTLQGTPGQFHFFNSYTYDSALDFTVDGLLREKVPLYGFSAYYPSFSAFNEDPTQPNSKLIAVNDPLIQTEFYNFNTFQFTPATSYLVMPNYGSYDTVYSPEKNNIPNLIYYLEDIDHPYDGTCRVRFINAIASQPSVNDFNISPATGAGTSVDLPGTQTAGQFSTIANNYTSIGPGQKNVSVTLSNGYITTKMTFLPATLSNSQNYTFIMTGDLNNYLNGIQPRPRLFLYPDGDPAHTQELTLSSLSYPGNATTQAQVTVIDDAYNLPGVLTFGGGISPVQYHGVNLVFNTSTLMVSRWPVRFAGNTWTEDVGDVFDPGYPGNEPELADFRMATTTLPANAYSVQVLPNGGFSPIYDRFTYNFEQGLSYTVCMLPDNTTDQQCGVTVFQNDNSPASNLFRLRVINLLNGTAQIDVHEDSLTGPLLATAAPYGQQTDYLNLAADTRQHQLFFTTAGTTTPLFQTASTSPILLSFNGGNSGTVFVMGVMPGTPVSTADSFGPYVLYHSDASVNPYAALASQQLYFTKF